METQTLAGDHVKRQGAKLLRKINWTRIMINRFLIPGVAALLVGGCAHTRSASEFLGVKVGDVLVPERPAIVYTCREWQSTTSIWISGPAAAQCIKAKASLRNTDHVLFGLPDSSVMRIVRIQELNLVDSDETLIYVEIDGIKGRFIINDLHFGALNFTHN